ncbi:unnamed protein product [Durusdinium trenchii]|uniref:Uncharacterized protein n=1 Tax=Durusdinium trenchii TaxID=1381693 RepID=A0ABP0L6R4_9DINO
MQNGAPSRRHDLPELAPLLEKSKQVSVDQIDLITNLLEAVWWVKDELLVLSDKYSKQEACVLQQAARIAALEQEVESLKATRLDLQREPLTPPKPNPAPVKQPAVTDLLDDLFPRQTTPPEEEEERILLSDPVFEQDPWKGSNGETLKPRTPAFQSDGKASVAANKVTNLRPEKVEEVKPPEKPAAKKPNAKAMPAGLGQSRTQKPEPSEHLREKLLAAAKAKAEKAAADKAAAEKAAADRKSAAAALLSNVQKLTIEEEEDEEGIPAAPPPPPPAKAVPVTADPKSSSDSSVAEKVIPKPSQPPAKAPPVALMRKT